MHAAEIDAMPAGHRLDSLIAERVMGWTKVSGNLYKDADGTVYWIGLPGNQPRQPHVAFHPSADIASAWLVVEALRQRGIAVTISTKGPRMYTWAYTTGHDGVDSPHTWAETPELAICRAALKAMLESEASQ